MSVHRLNELLMPDSVALIGGSSRPGSVGHAILRNLVESGYGGRFGVVNARHADVGGLATVKRLSDLDFVPQLVVVTVPATEIIGVIEEAGRLGVAGALIVSAGLGHGEGSLSAEVHRLARRYNMRIVGPNCLGFLMPHRRLNVSFAAGMPKTGSLALISQSGAIAAGMVGWSSQRNVGFSGIVSIGDQLDVDIADLLDYFALDPKTKAILLYVEAITDARKFMSAARAAARIKPLIVVKAGRLAEGAKAAATHTGSLAGSDAVYDAALRRAGALRVADLRELFDCAETLGRVSTPFGKRLAILTNGGGVGVMAVDRLVELGGVPAKLSSRVKQELDKILPPTWSAANPVDIIGDADAARYGNALRVLLSDPENDAVLVMNVETAIASADDVADTVATVATDFRQHGSGGGKPVLAVWIGATPQTRARLSDAGIPNYPTGGDAVRGFMHLVQYRELVSTLAQVPPALPSEFEPDLSTAKSIVELAVRDGRSWLDPIEVAGLLAAYRIPMVTTFAASNASEAMAYASRIFEKEKTVVLKIHSREIVHKSDIGGVVLNLTSTQAVGMETERMIARARAARPDATILGVIVQEMIVRPKARELILGLGDDATFGTVIVFGRGGTAVEIIDDKALALPPLDLPLARDLVGRTRVSRLMRGYRDVPAVASDAVPMTLVKLSQMAADLPEIRELDINPLVADETGVLALDARVSIGAPHRRFAGAGPSNLAVRPYPSQWQRNVEVREGWRIDVRPIRPEDEPAIHEFLGHVNDQDRRLRFFAPTKHFSHEFIARLTQLDYARAMAFVAFEVGTDEVLGVVRLHSDSVYETGEYAILLRSDLKGRGLGWCLMKLIIEYARSEGLKKISGEVLQENTTMLSMCRQLGFVTKTDREDPSLNIVSLDIVDREKGVPED